MLDKIEVTIAPTTFALAAGDTVETTATSWQQPDGLVSNMYTPFRQVKNSKQEYTKQKEPPVG